MKRVSPFVFLLLCLFLGALSQLPYAYGQTEGNGGTEEYDPCKANIVCERKVADDCPDKKIFFFTIQDTDCETSRSALNSQYDAEFLACESRKDLLELQCRNERLRRKIAGRDSLLKNGEECLDDGQCLSGYCYPGPPNTKGHYCLRGISNCAVPQKEGASYGEVISLEGRTYQCFRPVDGRAQWREVVRRREAWLIAGEYFRDTLAGGSSGPEMVVVPPGRFQMGSPHTEKDRDPSEGPQHLVTIGAFFAMSKYEITFDEYDKFAESTKRILPKDEGWGRGRRPVINVSWHDAAAYADWLSKETGERYRLPSEAEWEYAARAGTETRYWWGDGLGRAESGGGNANCKDCGSQWDGKQSAPVGSFEPNPFGLYDTAGNVREWVRDCWRDNYKGAPADGSVWQDDDCDRRVNRDASWDHYSRLIRPAARDSGEAVNAKERRGFRLVSDF